MLKHPRLAMVDPKTIRTLYTMVRQCEKVCGVITPWLRIPERSQSDAEKELDEHASAESLKSQPFVSPSKPEVLSARDVPEFAGELFGRGAFLSRPVLVLVLICLSQFEERPNPYFSLVYILLMSGELYKYVRPHIDYLHGRALKTPKELSCASVSDVHYLCLKIFCEELMFESWQCFMAHHWLTAPLHFLRYGLLLSEKEAVIISNLTRLII
jgi:hypothetical protein